MNREQIIQMAREAEFPAANYPALVSDGDWDALERFAALVAAAEREAIMEEWWMCVQSDLENGVKSLNERASEKWHKEYPAISQFDAAIRTRGQS